ncbi:HNH endonuclease signature motif containing protein [Aquimarina sp. AU474]|uniref:HNH endonuclease n=1 Tax=Aquimarina sp. AU474 TaxID=2108529 RepID=UPI0013594927|nr:HNH endonuclease signature motif containing protein [Aquimarina sp. AU474]
METIKGKSSSRPRVRPLEHFDKEIRVEFPRNLREENPIGTRFRADVKVSQKTKNGEPSGNPYLVATDSSIIKLEFKPSKSIKAIKLNTVSDRAYEYIEKEFKTDPSLIQFLDFREKAYQNSIIEPKKTDSTSSNTKRSHIIKTYALSRANGKCESCNDDAPFLKRNGQPYLEVHHIIELSNGGSDSPQNVAAICPNCHKRVTHGQDAEEFNNKLKNKITELEKELTE